MDSASKDWRKYVIINPIDVIFKEGRDAEGKSQSYIDLVNKSSENILFKVKTTDPQGYIVRPNQGILLPDATMNVRIQCLKDIAKVRRVPPSSQ
jgi:hypothetical protein